MRRERSESRKDMTENSVFTERRHSEHRRTETDLSRNDISNSVSGVWFCPLFFHRVRSAFTLIELLVVIAVIGILSGMLLPALASAKLSGQSIGCFSNQKNLMTSFFAYSDANGDWMFAPSAYASFAAYGSGQIADPSNWLQGYFRAGRWMLIMGSGSAWNYKGTGIIRHTFNEVYSATNDAPESVSRRYGELFCPVQSAGYPYEPYTTSSYAINQYLVQELPSNTQIKANTNASVFQRFSLKRPGASAYLFCAGADSKKEYVALWHKRDKNSGVSAFLDGHVENVKSGASLPRETKTIHEKPYSCFKIKQTVSPWKPY